MPNGSAVAAATSGPLAFGPWAVLLAVSHAAAAAVAAAAAAAGLAVYLVSN
jgi:hypothetical protein